MDVLIPRHNPYSGWHVFNPHFLEYFRRGRKILFYTSDWALFKSLLFPKKQSIRPKIKKNVCLLYPYLPTFTPPSPPQKKKKKNIGFFFFFFHQKITIFPLRSKVKIKKKKKKKMFFLPTYPTKKYRVGVQQTNNFLRMA